MNANDVHDEVSDDRTPRRSFRPRDRGVQDFRPVADHGLLADCSSAALVDRDGSID